MNLFKILYTAIKHKSKWLVDTDKVFLRTGGIHYRKREPWYSQLAQALLDEVDIGRTQTSYVERLRRQLYNEGKIQEDLRQSKK